MASLRGVAFRSRLAGDPARAPRAERPTRVVVAGDSWWPRPESNWRHLDFQSRRGLLFLYAGAYSGPRNPSAREHNCCATELEQFGKVSRRPRLVAVAAAAPRRFGEIALGDEEAAMASRKRRANGEGTIYQRSDGLWCGQLVLPSGKRHTVYGKLRRTVVEKLASVRQSPNRLPSGGRLTVAQFLERWMDDAVRPSVRPSTLANYRSVLSCHVLPRIGGRRLGQIAPLGVQALYSELESDGVSPRLRQLVHAILRRAFQQAVRWNLIAENPCDFVSRPRVARKEVAALSHDDVRRLLRAVAGDRLEALYVLAVTTGLRQGELFGLRWKDVDFRGKTIAVQRSVVEVNGRLLIQEPKTSAGRRLVALPGIACEGLRAHRARGCVEIHPEAWVFTNTRGGVLRKSNFLSRSWWPLRDRIGLPRAPIPRSEAHSRLSAPRGGGASQGRARTSRP